MDRKHNVSATMFPEMDKQEDIDRKHTVSAQYLSRWTSREILTLVILPFVIQR